MPGALVLLSGGQDSTTCLYWALREFDSLSVQTVTFDYGQRHRREIDCAARIALDAGVENFVLPVNTFAALGGNALTDTAVDVRPGVDPRNGLPNTFVPGRNLIFLTFAAALAYDLGCDALVTGTSQTDYSGYPDCRAPTLEALETAIGLGMERRIRILAPLMHLSKADTVRLAQEVGAIEALANSHTCYNGTQPPCGGCPACLIRASGFKEAGVADPLEVQAHG